MSSFEFIIHKACYLCSYRRVTGLIITHQRAALFTARRQEMIEVLERSFFYLLNHPEVHSPHSEIPFQVIFRLIELVIVSIALHVLSSLQLFYCVVSSFCSRSSRMLYSFSYLIFRGVLMRTCLSWTSSVCFVSPTISLHRVPAGGTVVTRPSTCRSSPFTSCHPDSSSESLNCF